MLWTRFAALDFGHPYDFDSTSVGFKYVSLLSVFRKIGLRQLCHPWSADTDSSDDIENRLNPADEVTKWGLD